MKFTNTLIAIALVLVASGCIVKGKPIVSQANSTSATYRLTGTNLDKAQALADAHCATYGRQAVQDQITRGEGNDRIVSYNCR